MVSRTADMVGAPASLGYLSRVPEVVRRPLRPAALLPRTGWSRVGPASPARRGAEAAVPQLPSGPSRKGGRGELVLSRADPGVVVGCHGRRNLNSHFNAMVLQGA